MCKMKVAAAMMAAGWCSAALADVLVSKTVCGENEIRLYAQPLAYEVLRGGETVVLKTPIALMQGAHCYGGEACTGTVASRREGTLSTPVYKKRQIELEAAESVSDFGDYAVRTLARRDGVAWRFETKRAGAIVSEGASVTLPPAARCWFNRTGIGSLGCEETVPEVADATALPADPNRAIYLPFVYRIAGKTVAVTESDVHDYPIWNFGNPAASAAGVRLDALMARYPVKTHHAGGDWSGSVRSEKGGRWVRVDERANLLAKGEAPRTLPWRVFVLADSPVQLAEADIVYALATPAAADSDFGWVKPGKVAWDWWNCFDNAGDSGCNTKTYERFIDFAAKHNVEYVIFDEGWSAKLDIWRDSPEVDVPHLIEYGKKRGVGIILWMAWAQIYGEEERVARHFAELGAKGFKVDFMDRGDAEVAVFLEKFAAACARHRMLIDYHGVYRPTGLSRTYPNIVNYEGVHGLEQMKWSPADKDMPFNDVLCFYLRLTAGPMDYTPGAMINLPYGKYTAGKDHLYPGSVGTRAHQMALMAAYEAPLQMLCDSPTQYERNLESFRFMAATPVVWDETVGIAGDPESHVVVARKARDGAWYVAGINNRRPLAAEFTLPCLGEGEWTAEIFRDAPDSSLDGAKYVHERLSADAGKRWRIDLAPGGGFVMRLERQK